MKIIDFDKRYSDQVIDLFLDNYLKLNKKFNNIFPSSINMKEQISNKLFSLSEENPLLLCLEKDEIIGYMGGYVFSNERHGKAVYIPEWANCSVSKNSNHIYEILFSRLSLILNKREIEKYIISVLITKNSVYSTLNLLGFGCFVIDVIKDLRNLIVTENDSNNIRKATIDDVDVLYNFKLKLSKYLSKAPIFLPFLEIPLKKEIRDQIEKDEFPFFIYSYKNQDVGFIKTSKENNGASYIARDPKTFSITGAFLDKEFRHHGFGKELLDRVFLWGLENNYIGCETDFESSNIPGRIFWTRNFEPFSYSFSKILDKGVFKK